MKEKITSMVSEVMKQIGGELRISETLFTESTFNKTSNTIPFLLTMLYEKEKEYFELRIRLSKIKIFLSNYNSKDDDAIVEVSSTLTEVIKIHKSLRFINNIVKCNLVEYDVIERDSLKGKGE